MSKHGKKHKHKPVEPLGLDELPHDEHYAKSLHELQVELVKFQRDVIAARRRVLVILEGRDTAGKDGTIKRITEHLSPRETRVVALSKPSDREAGAWYFQRYVPHLPSAGEIVLFNRSWYNRAGVEPVMGFCTDAECEIFLRTVVPFEMMLADGGIEIVKYYLDIDRDEQEARLKDRARDPLKQWKISPIDQKALKRFDDYTEARDAMLRHTDSARAPWVVVRANDKKRARLNIIRDLIGRFAYDDADIGLAVPEEAIVRRFDASCIADGFLAR